MTEPEKAPTATEPTETTEYSPGGDMAAGTAHAHIETPEEIEAEPIDDAELARAYVESGGGKPPTDEESAELQRAAAANELPHRTLALPIESTITVAPYRFQHAKVLRFEVSIGANDEDRTLEEFETDVRAALTRIGGNPIHNVTMTGGYYIIDGTVCLERDYDPASKNRKPGTFPPPWAGGPVSGKGEPYQPPASPTYDTPETVAVKAKSAKAVVTALAENMNQEVKAKS